METASSVRSAIREYEWTVSIDIQDADLHVPMARPVRKYLRFMVNCQVYQFVCLPFGLATSPQEFTKLLRPVVQLLRLQGIKLHVYLDDWLIRALPPLLARTHADLVLRVLQYLGWVINFSKSDLVPSQQFEFIGMQFDTCAYTVAPLLKMWVKIQTVLDHWRCCPMVTARDLHRMLGMLTYMATACAQRSASPPLNPVVGVGGLVPGDRGLVRPDPSSFDHSPSGVLVGLSCSVAGGFTECPRDRVDSIHWCLQPRLGSSAGSQVTAGDVVPSAGYSAYQSVRDGGSASGSYRFPAPTQVSGSAPDVRQRRGDVVHREGRRDQIVQTDPYDDSALQILWPEGNHVVTSAPSRVSQCPSRCSVESVPDPHNGVVYQQPASLSGVLRMEGTSDRSVRNFCQKEAACLRITIPGPQGQVRQCDVSTVDGNGNGVRLPTIQDAAGCSQQDPHVQRRVIIVAPRIMSASWMPELLELSLCPPIPLDGDPLLTQEVWLPRGHVETRHYRPSNLHSW